jgi:tetratricopeptide (TPR) repeat protein
MLSSTGGQDMACNNSIASIVAGCFLALAFSESLLSQDAEVPTRQGFELMNQGRYREAEEFLLRAFEIAGPANATAVYNLASLYQRRGRFQEAERLHRLALEQIERMRGPFDPAVAQSLNDLGALHRSLGRYSRAIDLLERAVQILDRNPQEKIACSALQ